MSVFSWMFAKTPPSPGSDAPSAATKGTPPRASSGPASVDPLSDLKHQRHERRENLYDVVRNVMLRSEVLASHYKFKVLSLDARGRQFLVMIDLLGDQVLSHQRWSAVEQLMAMTAAQRYDLQVKAGHRVLLIDDLIATGGTMMAGKKLLEKLGAEVMEGAAIVDLPELGGSAKLRASGLPLFTLVDFEGL